MNWFKKKLISVTLIGSLVFGITGQAVFATAGPQETSLNNTLADIWASLSVTEQTYVTTAKTKFSDYIGLGNDSVGQDIWNDINDKLTLNTTLPEDKIIRPTVNGLFAKLALIQLSVGSSSLSLSSDEIAMLNQMAAIGGVTLPSSWSEEVAQFINQVQSVLEDNATTLAGTIISYSSGGLTTAVITSIKDILKDSSAISSNKIVILLKSYLITAAELNSLVTNVRAGIGGTEFDNANNAILFGFFRINADLILVSGTNPATYKLSAFDRDLSILSSLISYSSNSGSISVAKNGSGQVLISGTAGSATIKGTLNIPSIPSVHGKEIISQLITLGSSTSNTDTNNNNNNNNNTTVVLNPNSGIPTPAPLIPTLAPEKAVEVGKELDKTLAALPTPVPGQDAQSNRKEATKAVAAAIEKQSQLDVSTSVQVTDGKAKVVLDTTQLADLFKTVKENADNLNAKLGAIDPNAEKAKVTVTLDLGVQTSSNEEIPISADLVQKAKDAGIDSIAIKVNGVSLAADVDQFKVNTTLNIDKKDTKEATDVTKLKVASDVYNFEFTEAGGNQVTFTKPVTIKLPIADITNVNTDILTLAKIINGKLEFYGGKYNTAGKYFESSRKSFSTYVIVENKVDFNDTSSVQTWAGESIGIAAAKGILQGRSEGIFAPNDKVTRAEFATMIVNTFHLEDATATSDFADVKASDWFASSVAAAAKAGLINGRTASTFEPNATISRAEMATISARALKIVKGYKNISDNAAALAKFNDASSINASLTESVALASSQGVVIGSNNSFNPNGLSTRAEAAVVIVRLLDL